MSAPLIAVPTCHVAAGAISGWRPGAFALPDSYVAALRRAGARPVLLTSPDPAPAEEVLAPFDGLLLAGGGDLDPAAYNARAHPAVLDVEPDRDTFELALVRAADRLALPVLGICRGLQVMNVAFGGTLHPHLPDLGGLIDHGEPDGGNAVTHVVRVQPGSHLATACGQSTSTGVARHHQAVDRLGEGLVATAWTEDGIVEGLERETDWTVAVQWHPEATAADDPVQQRLFDALVEQAARPRRQVA